MRILFLIFLILFINPVYAQYRIKCYLYNKQVYIGTPLKILEGEDVLIAQYKHHTDYIFVRNCIIRKAK